MVSILSPGVYVIEKDVSVYPASIASTTVGIVGFATKGPVNKPTLITSQENLFSIFGPATETLPGQGLLGASEILEVTNSLYYVRAAIDGSQEASATVALGGCPAIGVSSMGIGTTSAITFRVNVVDNAGVSAFSDVKEYTINASSVTVAAGSQQRALIKAFGSDLESLALTCQTPYGIVDGVLTPSGLTTSDAGILVGSFPGRYAQLQVSASHPVLMEFDLSGNYKNQTPVSQVVAYGTTIDTSAVKYQVESLYPGTGYNLGKNADNTVKGNEVEIKSIGGENFIVTVNDAGGAYETFKASFTDRNGLFLTTVINTGLANMTSDIIKGNLVYLGDVVDSPSALDTFIDKFPALVGANYLGVTQSTGTEDASAVPRFVKLIEGEYPLLDGTDGANTSNGIGNSSDFAAVIGDAALKTGIYALDDDILNISVAVVPGIHDQDVQNKLITLAETSTNFLAIVSPPKQKDTVQEAIDWSNGFADDRTAAINSSYAAIYWPHVQQFIPAYGQDVWLDAAIYGARQIIFTAATSELWFAPAGFIRGRLTKPTDVEVRLNQGDRDTLYSGGNAINPIVNFPQQGITIFGQRTAQRLPTALDRINVRLLAIYLKKLLLASVQSLLFEPNDPILWDTVVDLVNPILEDIQQRRGITDYAVVCDESTNTPLRVERNELWCKVAIRPTKTAEAIVFELNLTAQSGSIL